jgi:hypothetical protein
MIRRRFAAPKQKLRIEAGESLYVPGGLRHNETAASRDLELLEIGPR